MTAAALALLLAASLLQPGASLDDADARAVLRRLARERKASRRPAQRRLTGEFDVANMTKEHFGEECVAACPALEDMIRGSMMGQMAMQNMSDLDSWAGEAAEIVLFCDHQSTIQCVVGEGDKCNHDPKFYMLADKLECICDTCPGAKQAWAKYYDTRKDYYYGDGDDDGDDDHDNHDDGPFATTTEPMMVDSTPDPMYSHLDYDLDDVIGACARYDLGICVAEYPMKCGALADLNFTLYTEDEAGQILNATCENQSVLDEDWLEDFLDDIGDEYYDDENDDEYYDEDYDGYYDDDDDYDGNHSDEDYDGYYDDDYDDNMTTSAPATATDDDTDDDAVVGSCGPVGLGFFAASLPPVMAALQFMAA